MGGITGRQCTNARRGKEGVWLLVSIFCHRRLWPLSRLPCGGGFGSMRRLLHQLPPPLPPSSHFLPLRLGREFTKCFKQCACKYILITVQSRDYIHVHKRFSSHPESAKAALNTPFFFSLLAAGVPPAKDEEEAFFSFLPFSSIPSRSPFS